MNTILTEVQCKERIYQGFSVRCCSRKVWKDSYCKQHHPDFKKEQRDKKAKAWAEEVRLLAENRDKQARKINARNRIIDAAKNIALNSTIPSSAEHNRFAFVLIEDYMELADAYLEYEKTA